MGHHPIHTTINVAMLACALLFGAWAAPAPAQETAGETAREIVEGVLRKTKKSPAGDLGAWSRSVIERALERAGKNPLSNPRPPPGRGPCRPAGKRPHRAPPRPRSHRLHEPVGPRCEPAGMEPGGGADRRPAGPARTWPPRTQGYGQAYRGAPCGRRWRRDRPAPVSPLRYHRGPGRRSGPWRGPALYEQRMRRRRNTTPRPHQWEHRSRSRACDHRSRGRSGTRDGAAPPRKPERRPAMKRKDDRKRKPGDPLPIAASKPADASLAG